MKKLICLFSCLFGYGLTAMGDNVAPAVTYIICIENIIKKTTSTDSLLDCPVKSPKPKKGFCPVSPVPKKHGVCPVPSPKPIKVDNTENTQNLYF